jgi:hypothetical protein
MRDLNLTENEQEFFTKVKMFLFETKKKYPNLNVVTFYQSLIENKIELQKITNSNIKYLHFEYKPDNSEFACCETFYISSTENNIIYEIELSGYNDLKLSISEYKTTYDSFIELDEDYASELYNEWLAELREYELKSLLKDLDSIECDIEALTNKRLNIVNSINKIEGSK